MPDYTCSLTTIDKLQPVEKPVSELSLQKMEKIHVARVLESTAWHKRKYLRNFEHLTLAPTAHDQSLQSDVTKREQE